jgi:hypothetical protein
MFPILRLLWWAPLAGYVMAAWSGTATADAQLACAGLGGTQDAQQSCNVHRETGSYKLDFRFPVGYPDQQPLTDYLTQERDGFLNWVTESPSRGRAYPYELDIIGTAYRSGSSQTLVLTVGNDTGVHPVTSFKAFNYDVSKHAPITFDTLFKPDTRPLEVLNPIIERELTKRGTKVNDLGADAYQNFAITDDVVIFFFDQDGLLPHEDGAPQIAIARTELASVLAY